MKGTKRLFDAWPRENLAIALCCLALIGVGWTAVLGRVHLEHADAVADAAKQNANLAMALEEHTIRTLKGIDQSVLHVRRLYLEQGLKLGLHRLIQSGEIDDSLFAYVGILDEHGDLILAASDFKPGNAADREYFKVQQRRSTDEPFIGPPVTGRNSGRPGFHVSRRIRKADGTFGGVVFVMVDPGYFSAFYTRADLGDEGLVTLVGLDGITRARQVGRTGSFGQDMRESTLIAEQAKAPVGSFLSRGRLEGVPRFYSYRTLRQYPLIVAVGTSEAETLAPVRQRKRNYYVGAGMVSALMAILSAGLMTALARKKRASDALAESENRYRQIFENTVDGVFVLDVTPDRRFKCVAINPAEERSMGLTNAEASGHFIEDVLSKDVAETVIANYRRCVNEGRPIDCEYELDPPAGHRIFSTTLLPMRDSAGQICRLIGIAHDITERTQKERELRRQKELLQSIVDHIPAALVYINPNGSMQWVNRHWQQMLGWSLEEAQHRDILSDMYPDPGSRREAMRSARAGSGIWSEFRTRTRDGRTIDTSWANVLHSDGTSIGIGQEITGRKRFEEALSEARARLQTIFDASPLAIVTMDRAGKVTMWNASAERIFGWSSQEVLGRAMPYLSEDQMQAFHSLLEREFDGRSHTGLELTRRRKDGLRIVVRIWTAPLPDASGQIANVVAMFEDVTLQKRQEQALGESQDHLRQAYEQRERLSRDLHDGTVQSIYAIGMGLEHARRLVAEDSAKAQASLTEVIAGLNGVIREIRGHIRGLEPLIPDWDQLRAELEMLVSSANATNALQFRLDADPLVPARWSPHAAYEVVNIVREAVSNSLRHSGGKEGVVSWTDHNGVVRLEIADDGVGLDVAARWGDGQGLRNIAARAQALSAQLDIRSRPGHGTRIIVDIPLQPAHAGD